jgi:hypothetical protein
MTAMEEWGKARVKIGERTVRASVSAATPAARRVADMAKIESKDAVRRKVRETQAQANRERLQRESANREDMVAFLVAEQKLAAVDEWEAERHEQVRLEADQRREEQRLEGARALARMRERGETVAGIALLGARSEKIVRSYLRKVPKAKTANGTRSAVDGAAPRDGDAASQAIGFDSASGTRQAADRSVPRDSNAGSPALGFDGARSSRQPNVVGGDQ